MDSKAEEFERALSNQKPIRETLPLLIGGPDSWKNGDSLRYHLVVIFGDKKNADLVWDLLGAERLKISSVSSMIRVLQGCLESRPDLLAKVDHFDRVCRSNFNRFDLQKRGLCHAEMWPKDDAIVDEILRTIPSSEILNRDEAICILGTGFSDAVRELLSSRGFKVLGPSPWSELSNPKAVSQFLGRIAGKEDYSLPSIEVPMEAHSAVYDPVCELMLFPSLNALATDRERYAKFLVDSLKRSSSVVVTLTDSDFWKIPGYEIALSGAIRLNLLLSTIEFQTQTVEQVRQTLADVVRDFRSINENLKIIFALEERPLPMGHRERVKGISEMNALSKAKLRMAMSDFVDTHERCYFFDLTKESELVPNERAAFGLELFSKRFIKPAIRSFIDAGTRGKSLEDCGLVLSSRGPELTEESKRYIDLQGPVHGRHCVFHQACQALYRADGRRTPPATALATQGFEVFKGLIGSEDVKKIQGWFDEFIALESDSDQAFQRAQAKIAGLQIGGTKSTKDIKVPPSRLPEVMNALQKALRADLVQSIEAALESYFRINHFLMTRTGPTSAPAGSFRWHRDLAPDAQVHLMLYLTPTQSDGSGGCTEFLPKRESVEMDATRGYSFPPVPTRVENLRDAGASPSIVSRIQRPVLESGDGVLFLASRILHKGVAPLVTTREVVTFVFTPSLNSWEASLSQYGYDVFKDRFYTYDILANVAYKP